MAILTSQRIAILSSRLEVLTCYIPANKIFSLPTSILWIASTVVFTTQGGSVRYIPKWKRKTTNLTKLICTLGQPDSITHASSAILLACLPDRLIYAKVTSGSNITQVF